MDKKANMNRKLSHVIVLSLIVASIISIYILNEIFLKDDFELEYDWNYYGATAKTSFGFSSNLSETQEFFLKNNFTEMNNGLNHNGTQFFSSAKGNINGTVISVSFINETVKHDIDTNTKDLTIDYVLFTYYSQNSHIFDTIEEVENSPQYLSDKAELEGIANNVSTQIESWFEISAGNTEIEPLMTFLH